MELNIRSAVVAWSLSLSGVKNEVVPCVILWSDAHGINPHVTTSVGQMRANEGRQVYITVVADVT